jgi:UrcA family protein
LFVATRDEAVEKGTRRRRRTNQTTETLMRNLLALTALVGTAWLAQPAQAQPASPVMTIHVIPHGDLDLRTAEGRSRLDRRIRTSVQEACGTASEADLSGLNEVRRCRAEALALAYAQRDRLLAARTDAIRIARRDQ